MNDITPMLEPPPNGGNPALEVVDKDQSFLIGTGPPPDGGNDALRVKVETTEEPCGHLRLN